MTYSSSPFLALPAELRNAIYTFALTTPSGSLTFNPSTRRFDVSSIGAGLLTTCRALFEETQYLPLQLNKLVFEIPVLHVKLMVLLAKLTRLEEEMGWVVKTDVSVVGAWSVAK
jgi:hypothetical protein